MPELTQDPEIVVALERGVGAALDRIAVRVYGDVGKIHQNQHDANEKAIEFARLLSAGVEAPEAASTTLGTTSGYGSPSGYVWVGMVQVYLAWNQGRGVTNPVLPWHAGYGKEGGADQWRLAEKMLANLGEWFPYSEIRTSSLSPDVLVGLMYGIEGGNVAVVARKRTKGGVAWMLRERRPDDPETPGSRHTWEREQMVGE